MLRAQTSSAMRARWASRPLTKRPEDEEVFHDDLSGAGSVLQEQQEEAGLDLPIDYELEAELQQGAPDPKRQKVEYKFVDGNVGDDVQKNPEADSSDPLSKPLGNMLIKQTNTLQFKYPWEKGYLGRFFGSDQRPGLEPPCIAPGNLNRVELHVEASDDNIKPVAMKFVSKPCGQSITQSVVRNVDSLDFVDDKLRKRARVVAGWWDLLCEHLDHSAVGRKISVEAGLDQLPLYALEVIDATFAVKSANTLQKRFYAFKAYRDWCHDQGVSAWLPLSERQAWEYVRFWVQRKHRPLRPQVSWKHADLDGICWA